MLADGNSDKERCFLCCITVSLTYKRPPTVFLQLIHKLLACCVHFVANVLLMLHVVLRELTVKR